MPFIFWEGLKLPEFHKNSPGRILLHCTVFEQTPSPRLSQTQLLYNKETFPALPGRPRSLRVMQTYFLLGFIWHLKDLQYISHKDWEGGGDSTVASAFFVTAAGHWCRLLRHQKVPGSETRLAASGHPPATQMIGFRFGS